MYKIWKAAFSATCQNSESRSVASSAGAPFLKFTSCPNQVIWDHTGFLPTCFSMFRALFCNLIGKLTVPDILHLYTVISSMFDLSNWRGCCVFTKSFEPRGEVFALVPSLLPKSRSSSLCIPAVWVRVTLTAHCSVLLPHFSFPFHILNPLWCNFSCFAKTAPVRSHLQQHRKPRWKCGIKWLKYN